jgi:hypothetical protein
VTFAAVVLVLIGALMLALGVGLVMAFAEADCLMGSLCLDARDLAGLGTVVAAAGIVHVAAGAGAWRRQTWGRLLGGLVATIGLVTTASPLLVSDSWWVVTVLWATWPVAYGISLAGLWRWYPPGRTHVERRT